MCLSGVPGLVCVRLPAVWSQPVCFHTAYWWPSCCTCWSRASPRFSHHAGRVSSVCQVLDRSIGPVAQELGSLPVFAALTAPKPVGVPLPARSLTMWRRVGYHRVSWSRAVLAGSALSRILRYLALPCEQ